MGAMKDTMLEQMEDEMSDRECQRCGERLQKDEAQDGICGYCQHLMEKDD